MRPWLQIIWLSILFCPAVTSLSQQPVYSFFRDDTLLRKKYLAEALRKKETLIAGLKKENYKDYRDAYDNMFSMVEDLLGSSRTVTEKRADDYIKAVAERIIRANPELMGLETRIIFSRDYAPNAYSIGDGTISFNAGLFVYLNSESEMAFILCHELAHYYLRHSQKKLDKMVYLANSDSLKKELKRLSKQIYRVGEQMEKISRALIFDIKKHSRDGEMEADRMGLQFLRKTGYAGTGFVSTMQLLDNIDDSSLFHPLELPKVFSFPGYSFKERWTKKESAIFGAMNPEESGGLTKKEKDSLKTHPDCSKRIALLGDSARTIIGKDFLVDEDLFRSLKQAFIPEILAETFRSGNISFNLYLSLQLLQEGRFVPLAVYSVARDLNIIYRRQKEHELGLVLDTESRYFRDDYNLLLRMLYRLRLNEVAELNEQFCNFYSEKMKDYEGFPAEYGQAIQYKSTHN